jgi:hypothetical protein
MEWVNPDVRIHPFHLDDLAFEGHGLAGVELSGKRMMRQQWRGRRNERRQHDD